ncbi:S-ribosylhomocysteine lyase [Peptostreptococcaceae bacterium AGR-M142]
MPIKVESFELDHTKVKAPYVRKAGKIIGEKGDIVQKYDLRFIQPNVDALPTGAIHTIEHLLAGYLRENIENIIDVSPMGCRTGFYMIKFGETDIDVIQNALVKALEKIIATKEEEVPALNAVQCGNYKDHSLFAAKEYCKMVIDGFKNK